MSGAPQRPRARGVMGRGGCLTIFLCEHFVHPDTTSPRRSTPGNSAGEVMPTPHTRHTLFVCNPPGIYYSDKF